MGQTMIVPSARAVSMIVGFEVGDAQAYIPHPIWPGGASGLTIGVGYDLGYASAAQIANDWHVLSEPVIHRLQIYAGIFGHAAAGLLPQARDIEVPYNAALGVFEGTDVPRTSKVTSDIFANCNQISADSFGALVSLVFNRGPSMIDTQPNANRLEMRQIRDAMASAKFQEVPGFIRSMKRIWHNAGLPGLLARRDAEAQLFEEGLPENR